MTGLGVIATIKLFSVQFVKELLPSIRKADRYS